MDNDSRRASGSASFCVAVRSRRKGAAVNTDFNYDYHVSFRPSEIPGSEIYHNYRQEQSSLSEVAGVSVFFKDPHENIFHTYSCYERGLDMLNAGYHLLDLVPKARDEDSLPFPQAWSVTATATKISRVALE